MADDIEYDLGLLTNDYDIDAKHVEELKVTVSRWRNAVRVHIRNYYYDYIEEEWNPTKKGLVILSEHIDNWVALLTEALQLYKHLTSEKNTIDDAECDLGIVSPVRNNKVVKIFIRVVDGSTSLGIYEYFYNYKDDSWYETDKVFIIPGSAILNLLQLVTKASEICAELYKEEIKNLLNSNEDKQE